MQEFSSVTASSYDAESLAPLLNEKAADGWSVVSIVAAGTNIVAYLQRETDVSTAVETPVEEAPVETLVEETRVETLVEETPTTDEPAADAPFVPAAAAAAAVVEEAPAAVDEPAGWASAPEAAADAAADTTDTSVAELAAQVSEPEPEPAVAEPAAAEAAPAAESTVPAGWYADPSGRFELRYWDGTAWTEHVSRAGQQFTDPPVA
jgi:hypothetical protein